jgi:signal peptidase II
MPEHDTGRRSPLSGEPAFASAATPDDGARAGKSTRRGRYLAWVLLAVAIIVVDQITKVGFDTALQYGERRHVLPFFDFTLLYNPGAAFSFLADGEGWQRWFFTGIALVAAIVILRLLWKHPRQTVFCAALACILGGALGNAIDRLVYGHVVDFLLFYWQDWHFPAFNVADVAITVGAMLLLLDEVLRWRRERRNVQP